MICGFRLPAYRNGYNGAVLKTDVPWRTWSAGSNPAAGVCGMYVPHNPFGLLLSAARTILLRAERDRPAAFDPERVNSIFKALQVVNRAVVV